LPPLLDLFATAAATTRLVPCKEREREETKESCRFHLKLNGLELLNLKTLKP
jgi:hypothetical protein